MLVSFNIVKAAIGLMTPWGLTRSPGFIVAVARDRTQKVKSFCILQVLLPPVSPWLFRWRGLLHEWEVGTDLYFVCAQVVMLVNAVFDDFPRSRFLSSLLSL